MDFMHLISCLPILRIILISFFKKDFIYLFIHERQRERHRQRKKQAPCREPDVGLDPRTPGSRSGPKADAKPLSHTGSRIILISENSFV